MKTRGLKEAKMKLGDLEEIISNLLKKKEKVIILESGCGYGKVMMELAKKFGDRIEITGMNLKPNHGDKKRMISFALSEKVIAKKDLKKMKIPKIIFGDAGEKIPFKTSSIDLVYSQVSVYLYKDKMNFFKEVGRVLSKEGIGLITYPGNKRIPKEFQPLLKIYKDDKQISFDNYIKKFKHIRLYPNKGGWNAIEIKKSNFKFNVELEATINVNHINKNWFGIQSIYYIKK